MTSYFAFRYSHVFAEGRALGYPECCTRQFVRNMRKAPEFGPIHHRSQWKAGARTGFIPCRRCAAKVNKGKVRLEDLIQNRLVSWSFTDRWTPEFSEETMTWDPLTTERMEELRGIAEKLNGKTPP